MKDAESGRDERRLESRLHYRAKVWLEVISSVPGEDSEGQILECTALDFSANGIQLETSEPLLPGSILPLYVETGGPSQPNKNEASTRYCLTGEVRWVKPVSTSGRYQIGFHLYESDQTSILEWKQFVAGQFQ